MLTDRCVLIGCLLIDSCDTYRSMIRIAHNRRFFLSSLVRFAAKENLWDQGSTIATTAHLLLLQILLGYYYYYSYYL